MLGVVAERFNLENCCDGEELGLRPEANVASERRVAIPTTSATLANDCGGGTVGGEPRSGDRLKPVHFVCRRWEAVFYWTH